MVVSRDRVCGGMAWTEAEREHDPAGDLSVRAVAAFFDTAQLLLSNGGSIILESTFRRGISEADLLPLFDISWVKYVHCIVPRTVAVKRCGSRTGREFVGAMLESRDKERWLRVEHSLELDVVPLVVDTTDGYSPGLNEIEAHARARIG